MTAPSKLSRVEARRFMSLRDVSVELGSLNVLIGPNGAGKSNFLKLLDMVAELSQGRLGLWLGQGGGASRFLHGGPAISPDLEVRLRFDDVQGYFARLVYATGDSLVFAEETAEFTGAGYDTPYTYYLGPGGHSESNLHREAELEPGKVPDHTLRCLRGLQRYHFHDTSATAGVKQLQPIGDGRTLRRDGANLAPFLFTLRQSDPSSYRRIEDAMRTVAPFFDHLTLAPDPARPDKIRLEWRHRDSDIYADASTLSDGSLRFLCLASVLLQPSPPPIIVIDEPELGLHPFAIHQIAELMRSASRVCQIVVATQSVTLLDQLGLAEVLVAERIDGATQLVRPDPASVAEWAESYSLGEMWQKNLIGGRPRH